jgi:hypothetical protein
MYRKIFLAQDALAHQLRNTDIIQTTSNITNKGIEVCLCVTTVTNYHSQMFPFVPIFPISNSWVFKSTGSHWAVVLYWEAESMIPGRQGRSYGQSHFWVFCSSIRTIWKTDWRLIRTSPDTKLNKIKVAKENGSVDLNKNHRTCAERMYSCKRSGKSLHIKLF